MRTRDLIRFKRHIEEYLASGHKSHLLQQAALNLAEIDDELEFRNRYRYRWELLAEDWGFDFPD